MTKSLNDYDNFSMVDLKGQILNRNKYKNNSLKGFVLEVDLEYPKDILKLQCDCPLVPDELEIGEKMLYK